MLIQRGQDGLLASQVASDLPVRPGSLTQAICDDDLIALWLNRPNLSRRTVRAAAMESHRFLMWCSTHGLDLRSVHYEHLLAYAAFLAAPSPADQWIASAKFPRTDARWRPFLGPLSESSQRLALVILKGMFGWASAAGYLARNPAQLLGQLALSHHNETVTRFLQLAAIPLLLRAVAQMPVATASDALRQARARFVVLAYYYSAARLSELADTDMHALRRGHDGTWWLHVLGKGRRQGKIPVPGSLLDEFRRYRSAFGLSALPLHDEDLPLILTTRGTLRRAQPQTVAKILKAAMASAAQIAKTEGLDELASQLALASTHWLRHSSLTHQLDSGMSLTTVQRNGRHADIKTTGRYLHKQDRQRHDETAGVWAGLKKLFDSNKF